MSAKDTWLDRAVELLPDVYEQFYEHVAGLHILIKRNPVTTWFRTGCLAVFKKRLFFVTAGHVLDEIEKAEIDFSLRITLLDSPTRPDNGIPLPMDMREYWHCKDPDIGLLPLTPHISKLVMANGSSKIWNFDRFDESTSAGNNCVDEPFHYLFGYPSSNVETRTRRTGSLISGDDRALLACLPVAQECRSDRQGPFWETQNAFFGRVSTARSEHWVVDDIKGMSGGFIIQVFKLRNQHLRGFPYAIQSSWLSNERVLKAYLLRPFLRRIIQGKTDEVE